MENNYLQTNEDDSPEKNEPDYCDPAYIGKTGLQIGIDRSNNPKVKKNLMKK